MYLTRKLMDEPVPAWIINLQRGENDDQPIDDIELFRHLGIDSFGTECRAVSIERYRHVIASGVDVDPLDSVIWVDYFEKAWEYGGWPKMMLIFDPQYLTRSFIEVPSSTDESVRERIRQHYPTVLTSRDGTKLWFSRLPEHDSRLGTDYERSYGRWIVPESHSPLKAVLIFTRNAEDAQAVDAAVSSC